MEPGMIRMGAYTIAGNGIAAGSMGSLLDLSFTVQECEPGSACELAMIRLLDDLQEFYVVNGSFTFSNEPTPTPVCVHSGDVTQDGSLSAADAQQAFLIVLGLMTPTAEQACAADCNDDGTVTAGDAQAIFLAVLGMGSCVDPIR